MKEARRLQRSYGGVSILGTRVLRTEDPGFLTTGAVYTEDVQDERLAGACYVHFVRSTVAHAATRALHRRRHRLPTTIARTLPSDGTRPR